MLAVLPLTIKSIIMSIYTVKFVKEANAVTPVINSDNIAVLTIDNGMKMMLEASWDDWDTIFIFPDNEKAEYFVRNYKYGMSDYRQGMLKDDYIFHVIICIYPIPSEVYAEQLRMSKDYS
jgi:hypothetical protein